MIRRKASSTLQRIERFCEGQEDLEVDDLSDCPRCNNKAVAYKRCIICGAKEDE